MYLVLGSPQDLSAHWAFEGLCNDGLRPVEFITSEQLAYARLWEHRVAGQPPSVRIVLGDGRTIWSHRVRAVLNRLVAAPPALVHFTREDDRKYAIQQLASFYQNWLQSLPGVVINRPQPHSFCGRWRYASEWTVLALRAGLPVPLSRPSTPSHLQTVIALKGKLCGFSLPDKTLAACLRLASFAESDLLGISLFQTPNGVWNFAGATPYPDLTAGGDALIHHLAALFTTGHAARELTCCNQDNDCRSSSLIGN